MSLRQRILDKQGNIHKKIAKIKEKIENKGLHVVYGELDENPYLCVYKKETSKNSKFELLFDKKGNLINLVCGKPNNACWISLK
jgi:hypothetical protein